jgi:hypothetical protein
MKIKLTPNEVASPAWQKVNQLATEKLAKARVRLEIQSCTQEETTKLRAQIAAYKELLAMAQPEREAADAE